MIGLKVSGIPRDQSPASEYIFRTRPTNLYLCRLICTSPRRILLSRQHLQYPEG